MRFQRLDLTRYGKFTDRSIVFGESRSGSPDLHLVYGPNEAGKSTTLAAMLDFLFGMPAQSRFNFLHAYNAMRIGALLDFKDGPRELSRIKKPNNSLLDSSDHPFAEGLLQAELGGMNREAYRAMFSLDDETLEEGGESILASQGDLGQLLFSATAGLAGFSKTLTAMRTETEAFFKPRARSHELAALKDELGELKKKRDEIDIRANDYAKLIEQRDQSALAYQNLLSDRARLAVAIESRDKQISALPQMRDLADLRDQLAPLAAVPEAPQHWASDVRDLEKRLTVLKTRISSKANRIAELELEISSLDRDEAALALEPQLEALNSLSARYLTAEIDIPKLEATVRETEREIAGILHSIGQQHHTSPRDLRLPVSTSSALRDLIESRSGLDAALRTAHSELQTANERLQAFKVDATTPEPHLDIDLMPLSQIMAVIRSQDHDLRLRLAEEANQRLAADLRHKLSALVHWSGEISALKLMPTPSNDKIALWKQSAKNLAAREQLLSADIEKAIRDISRLTAEFSSLKSSLGFETDRPAEQLRADRDAAWTAHRSQLTEETATAFEERMREDDLAWTARFLHASDLARANGLAASLAVSRADLELAQKHLGENLAQQQRLHQEHTTFWQFVYPDSDSAISAEEIENWLSKRELALQAAHALDMHGLDVESARLERAKATQKLKSALETAGFLTPDGDLNAMLEKAQAILNRFEREKAEFEKRTDARRNVEKRQQILANAQAELDVWQGRWDNLSNACWLGAGTSVAVVREVLPLVTKLGSVLDTQANYSDRIDKMKVDQATFSAAVCNLAETLSLDPEDREALSIWKMVQKRVNHARQSKDLIEQKERELANEQRDLKVQNDEFSSADAEQSRYITHFSVGTLDDVVQKLADLARRADLSAQFEKIKRQVRDALQVETLEAAESQLTDLDVAALALELSTLKSEKSDLDQRIQELYAAKVKAEDEVSEVGGDDAVARIEEARRTILIDIEDRAMHYVRLRSGILAAEQALRAYRETHRSAMMLRASEAFRMVSRGAYSGLAAQPEKDTEILIAISADGSSKLAEQMSKGTRFQLYLALRMAGYHEFATTRGSVPFIADDIMETFDDFRAEETFRLFAEMALVGQVIYFTHHRHLCDIAKSVCPDVKIHML